MKISEEEQILVNLDSLENFKKAVMPFLIKPVQKVITFGSNCHAKGRVLAFYYNWTITKRFQIHNHLFDWMVPLNYTLLALSARNNFVDAFGEFMTVKRYLGKYALFNDKYNFIFNHAFDGSGDLVTHDILTDELFHKYYFLIDDKFKHLTLKSQEAIQTDKKTLYMIFGDVFHSDPLGQRQEILLHLQIP